MVSKCQLLVHTVSNTVIGFLQNNRTADHVFTLRTLIDKYVYNHNEKIYACFIDFKKAFDSVFQSKSYGPTLNLKKTSTANLKESVFKFAHPLLYVSKVKSAISKLLVSVVLFSEKGV